MSHILQDGTGTKNKMKVDRTNRALTRSVSESASIEALDLGRQYVLHSHVLNVTNSSFTAVVYFENTGSLNLIVKTLEFSSKLALDSGASPVVDQSIIILVRQNPTGPSFSDNWHGHNADFGSANTVSATALQAASGSGGANGGSFTNSGQLIIHDILQCGMGSQRLFLDELKLRPGNSLGIQIIPPANNVDLDFHFNMICYEKD